MGTTTRLSRAKTWMTLLITSVYVDIGPTIFMPTSYAGSCISSSSTRNNDPLPMSCYKVWTRSCKVQTRKFPKNAASQSGRSNHKRMIVACIYMTRLNFHFMFLTTGNSPISTHFLLQSMRRYCQSLTDT